MSFEPSHLSDLGSEPSAPGSDSAAYDVAGYYLAQAAYRAKSTLRKGILLGLAAKAKAKAAATPGLLYGHEVAILQAAAVDIGTDDPASSAKLLTLSGHVLDARKSAQQTNPVYQGQRAGEGLARWGPWILGGLVLLGGGLVLSGRRRRSNPAEPDSWWRIVSDDVTGAIADTGIGWDELTSGQPGAIRRSIRRGGRRLVHADAAGRIWRKVRP